MKDSNVHIKCDSEVIIRDRGKKCKINSLKPVYR